MQFLNDKLGGYTMRGYSAVGHSSFDNIMVGQR
jgi:hypothetical protein